MTLQAAVPPRDEIIRTAHLYNATPEMVASVYADYVRRMNETTAAEFWRWRNTMRRVLDGTTTGRLIAETYPHEFTPTPPPDSWYAAASVNVL